MQHCLILSLPSTKRCNTLNNAKIVLEVKSVHGVTPASCLIEL